MHKNQLTTPKIQIIACKTSKSKNKYLGTKQWYSTRISEQSITEFRTINDTQRINQSSKWRACIGGRRTETSVWKEYPKQYRGNEIKIWKENK